MNISTSLAGQPLFQLFVGFTVLLTLGYFWGRRRNRGIYLSAFDDLVRLLKPTEQTFTNIGGAIGYHANLTCAKSSPVSKADITITLLPRQSWLYLPISLLIRRWDQLFITLYMKRHPPAEGHLIDARYAGSLRGPKITGAERLQRETLRWGARQFILYSANPNSRAHLLALVQACGDSGTIRHVAFVPHQKKCFIFMIPRRDTVEAQLKPLFGWLPSIVNHSEKGAQTP